MLILAKGRFSLYIRTLAFVVVSIFTFTTVAQSAPLEPSAPRLQTTDYRPETKIVSLAEQITIPPELGSIKEVYYPTITDQNKGSKVPESGSSKIYVGTEDRGPSSVVVHIEDAHSQLEAQKSTEAILRHLKDQYGFSTIFLEGGFGKLDPELLQFFKDPALNQKLMDRLEEKGLIGGVEKFLTEPQEPHLGTRNSGLVKTRNQNKSLVPSDESRAFGIESVALYRENLEQFRAVYAAKPETDKSLLEMRQRIVDQSAKVFHKELKDFFETWIFQNDTGSDLMARLTTLQKYAADILELDFEDAREQYDWPQLVRFFKLKKLEGLVTRDSGLVTNELRNLKEWLTKNHLAPFYSDVDLTLNKSPVPNPESRSFFEKFYESAAPKGFKFESYPNLSRKIGIAILTSELDAQDLFKEVERLNDQLVEKLAQTDAERKLIAEYREYCLLKKLFALELTRGEFEELSRRLETTDQRLALNALGLQSPVSSLVSQAMRFYETAERREQVMFHQMLVRMKELKTPNSILVTGGYHSEGLSEFFKQNGISYVRIAPRISKMNSDKNYLDVMLAKSLSTTGVQSDGSASGGKRRMSAKDQASLRQLTLTMGLNAIQQTVGVATADFYRSELRRSILEIGRQPMGVPSFNELIPHLGPEAVRTHGLVSPPQVVPLSNAATPGTSAIARRSDRLGQKGASRPWVRSEARGQTRPETGPARRQGRDWRPQTEKQFLGSSLPAKLMAGKKSQVSSLKIRAEARRPGYPPPGVARQARRQAAREAALQKTGDSRFGWEKWLFPIGRAVRVAFSIGRKIRSALSWLWFYVTYDLWVKNQVSDAQLAEIKSIVEEIRQITGEFYQDCRDLQAKIRNSKNHLDAASLQTGIKGLQERSNALMKKIDQIVALKLPKGVAASIVEHFVYEELAMLKSMTEVRTSHFSTPEEQEKLEQILEQKALLLLDMKDTATLILQFKRIVLGDGNVDFPASLSSGAFRSMRDLALVRRVKAELYQETLGKVFKEGTEVFQETSDLLKSGKIFKIFPFLGEIDRDPALRLHRSGEPVLNHLIQFIYFLECIERGGDRGFEEFNKGASHWQVDRGTFDIYHSLFLDVIRDGNRELIYLFALLHNIGKLYTPQKRPASERDSVGFYRHEEQGAFMIRPLIRYLFSVHGEKTRAKMLEWLVLHHFAAGNIFFGELSPAPLLARLLAMPEGVDKDKLFKTLAVLSFADQRTSPSGAYLSRAKANFYLNELNFRELDKIIGRLANYRLKRFASDADGVWDSERYEEIQTAIARFSFSIQSALRETLKSQVRRFNFAIFLFQRLKASSLVKLLCIVSAILHAKDVEEGVAKGIFMQDVTFTSISEESEEAAQALETVLARIGFKTISKFFEKGQTQTAIQAKLAQKGFPVRFLKAREEMVIDTRSMVDAFARVGKSRPETRGKEGDSNEQKNQSRGTSPESLGVIRSEARRKSQDALERALAVVAPNPKSRKNSLAALVGPRPFDVHFRLGPAQKEITSTTHIEFRAVSLGFAKNTDALNFSYRTLIEELSNSTRGALYEGWFLSLLRESLDLSDREYIGFFFGVLKEAFHLPLEYIEGLMPELLDLRRVARTSKIISSRELPKILMRTLEGPAKDYQPMLSHVNHLLFNAGNNPRFQAQLQDGASAVRLQDIQAVNFWIIKEGTITEVVQAEVVFKPETKLQPVHWVINVAKDKTESAKVLRRAFHVLKADYALDPRFVMEPLELIEGDLPIFVGEWVEQSDELHLYPESGSERFALWSGQSEENYELLSPEESRAIWYQIIRTQTLYSRNHVQQVGMARPWINRGDYVMRRDRTGKPQVVLIWDDRIHFSGEEDISAVPSAVLSNALCMWERDLHDGEVTVIPFDQDLDLAFQAFEEGYLMHRRDPQAAREEIKAFAMDAFIKQLPEVMAMVRSQIVQTPEKSRQQQERILHVLERVCRYLKDRVEKEEAAAAVGVSRSQTEWIDLIRKALRASAQEDPDLMLDVQEVAERLVQAQPFRGSSDFLERVPDGVLPKILKTKIALTVFAAVRRSESRLVAPVSGEAIGWDRRALEHQAAALAIRKNFVDAAFRKTIFFRTLRGGLVNLSLRIFNALQKMDAGNETGGLTRAIAHVIDELNFLMEFLDETLKQVPNGIELPEVFLQRLVEAGSNPDNFSEISGSLMEYVQKGRVQAEWNGIALTQKTTIERLREYFREIREALQHASSTLTSPALIPGSRESHKNRSPKGPLRGESREASSDYSERMGQIRTSGGKYCDDVLDELEKEKPGIKEYLEYEIGDPKDWPPLLGNEEFRRRYAAMSLEELGEEYVRLFHSGFGFFNISRDEEEKLFADGTRGAALWARIADMYLADRERFGDSVKNSGLTAISLYQIGLARMARKGTMDPDRKERLEKSILECLPWYELYREFRIRWSRPEGSEEQVEEQEEQVTVTETGTGSQPRSESRSEEEKIRLIEQVMAETEAEIIGEQRSRYVPDQAAEDLDYLGTKIENGVVAIRELQDKGVMGPNKKFADPGAGIGRMLALAVALTDVSEVIGIEKDPALIAKGKAAIAKLDALGVLDQDKIRWISGPWEYSKQLLRDIDAVYVFPPMRGYELEHWGFMIRPLMRPDAYLYDSTKRESGWGTKEQEEQVTVTETGTGSQPRPEARAEAPSAVSWPAELEVRSYRMLGVRERNRFHKLALETAGHFPPKKSENFLIAYWNGKIAGWCRLSSQDRKVLTLLDDFYVLPVYRRSLWRRWLARSFWAGPFLACFGFRFPEYLIASRLLEAGAAYWQRKGGQYLGVLDIIDRKAALGVQEKFLRAHRGDSPEWAKVKIEPNREGLMGSYRWIAPLDSFKPRIPQRILESLLPRSVDAASRAEAVRSEARAEEPSPAIPFEVMNLDVQDLFQIAKALWPENILTAEIPMRSETRSTQARSNVAADLVDQWLAAIDPGVVEDSPDAYPGIDFGDPSTSEGIKKRILWYVFGYLPEPVLKTTLVELPSLPLRERVRLLMRERKIVNAGELARLSGMSADSLYSMLRSETESFRNSNLMQISFGLRCDPALLLYGTDLFSAVAGMKVNERIRFFRKVRGWTFQQFVSMLELAGFHFEKESLSMAQKVRAVKELENSRGVFPRDFEKRRAITRALRFPYLFQNAMPWEPGFREVSPGFQIVPLPGDVVSKLSDQRQPSFRRLEAIRLARNNLSVKELTGQAEISLPNYYDIRNGKSGFTPQTLWKLARVLQVDPVLIYGGNPAEEILKLKSVGERLRLLRLRRGWSQRDLVHHLRKEKNFIVSRSLENLDFNTISGWEHDVTFPPLYAHDALIRVLGYPDLFIDLPLPPGLLEVTIKISGKTDRNGRPVARSDDSAFKKIQAQYGNLVTVLWDSAKHESRNNGRGLLQSTLGLKDVDFKIMVNGRTPGSYFYPPFQGMTIHLYGFAAGKAGRSEVREKDDLKGKEVRSEQVPPGLREGFVRFSTPLDPTLQFLQQQPTPSEARFKQAKTIGLVSFLYWIPILLLLVMERGNLLPFWASFSEYAGRIFFYLAGSVVAVKLAKTFLDRALLRNFFPFWDPVVLRLYVYIPLLVSLVLVYQVTSTRKAQSVLLEKTIQEMHESKFYIVEKFLTLASSISYFYRAPELSPKTYGGEYESWTKEIHLFMNSTLNMDLHEVMHALVDHFVKNEAESFTRLAMRQVNIRRAILNTDSAKALMNRKDLTWAQKNETIKRWLRSASEEALAQFAAETIVKAEGLIRKVEQGDLTPEQAEEEFWKFMRDFNRWLVHFVPSQKPEDLVLILNAVPTQKMKNWVIYKFFDQIDAPYSPHQNARDLFFARYEVHPEFQRGTAEYYYWRCGLLPTKLPPVTVERKNQHPAPSKPTIQPSRHKPVPFPGRIPGRSEARAASNYESPKEGEPRPSQKGREQTGPETGPETEKKFLGSSLESQVSRLEGRSATPRAYGSIEPEAGPTGRMARGEARSTTPKPVISTRYFDLMITPVLMVLTLPVVLAAVFSIWMATHQPILVRQERMGFKGEPFVPYKLRTLESDGKTPLRLGRFPLGKVLRKSAIDELPQFLNILKGEMSLFGPRPKTKAEIAKHPEYQEVLETRLPGLLSWWKSEIGAGQGFGEYEIPKVIEYNRMELQNWSRKLMARIIFRTATRMMKDILRIPNPTTDAIRREMLKQTAPHVPGTGSARSEARGDEEFSATFNKLVDLSETGSNLQLWHFIREAFNLGEIDADHARLQLYDTAHFYGSEKQDEWSRAHDPLIRQVIGRSLPVLEESLRYLLDSLMNPRAKQIKAFQEEIWAQYRNYRHTGDERSLEEGRALVLAIIEKCALLFAGEEAERLIRKIKEIPVLFPGRFENGDFVNWTVWAPDPDTAGRIVRKNHPAISADCQKKSGRYRLKAADPSRSLLDRGRSEARDQSLNNDGAPFFAGATIPDDLVVAQDRDLGRVVVFDPSRLGIKRERLDRLKAEILALIKNSTQIHSKAAQERSDEIAAWLRLAWETLFHSQSIFLFLIDPKNRVKGFAAQEVSGKHATGYWMLAWRDKLRGRGTLLFQSRLKYLREKGFRTFAFEAFSFGQRSTPELIEWYRRRVNEAVERGWIKPLNKQSIVDGIFGLTFRPPFSASSHKVRTRPKTSGTAKSKVRSEAREGTKSVEDDSWPKEPDWDAGSAMEQARAGSFYLGMLLAAFWEMTGKDVSIRSSAPGTGESKIWDLHSWLFHGRDSDHPGIKGKVFDLSAKLTVFNGYFEIFTRASSSFDLLKFLENEAQQTSEKSLKEQVHSAAGIIPWQVDQALLLLNEMLSDSPALMPREKVLEYQNIGEVPYEFLGSFLMSKVVSSERWPIIRPQLLEWVRKFEAAGKKLKERMPKALEEFDAAVAQVINSPQDHPRAEVSEARTGSATSGVAAADHRSEARMAFDWKESILRRMQLIKVQPASISAAQREALQTLRGEVLARQRSWQKRLFKWWDHFSTKYPKTAAAVLFAYYLSTFALSTVLVSKILRKDHAHPAGYIITLFLLSNTIGFITLVWQRGFFAKGLTLRERVERLRKEWNFTDEESYVYHKVLTKWDRRWISVNALQGQTIGTVLFISVMALGLPPALYAAFFTIRSILSLWMGDRFFGHYLKVDSEKVEWRRHALGLILTGVGLFALVYFMKAGQTSSWLGWAVSLMAIQVVLVAMQFILQRWILNYRYGEQKELQPVLRMIMVKYGYLQGLGVCTASFNLAGWAAVAGLLFFMPHGFQEIMRDFVSGGPLGFIQWNPWIIPLGIIYYANWGITYRLARFKLLTAVMVPALQPLVTWGFSILFFGQDLTFMQILSSAITLAGVVTISAKSLAEKGKKPPSPTGQPFQPARLKSGATSDTAAAGPRSEVRQSAGKGSARSMLFMPGTKLFPERSPFFSATLKPVFSKMLDAVIAGSPQTDVEIPDAMILDLEDSVSPEAKDAARLYVRARLEELRRSPYRKPKIIVRINSRDTGDWIKDLEMIRDAEFDGVMIPKVRSVKDVTSVREFLQSDGKHPDIVFYPIIELPNVDLDSFLSAEGMNIGALVLGLDDLTKALGVDRDPAFLKKIPKTIALLKNVCAQKGFGLIGPVFSWLKEQALDQEITVMKQYGCTGSLSIFPGQVQRLNSGFQHVPASLARDGSPEREASLSGIKADSFLKTLQEETAALPRLDRAWAKNVLREKEKLSDEGTAFHLDRQGRHFDTPSYALAKRILQGLGASFYDRLAPRQAEGIAVIHEDGIVREWLSGVLLGTIKESEAFERIQSLLGDDSASEVMEDFNAKFQNRSVPFSRAETRGALEGGKEQPQRSDLGIGEIDSISVSRMEYLDSSESIVLRYGDLVYKAYPNFTLRDLFRYKEITELVRRIVAANLGPVKLRIGDTTYDVYYRINPVDRVSVSSRQVPVTRSAFCPGRPGEGEHGLPVSELLAPLEALNEKIMRETGIEGLALGHPNNTSITMDPGRKRIDVVTTDITNGIAPLLAKTDIAQVYDILEQIQTAPVRLQIIQAAGKTERSEGRGQTRLKTGDWRPQTEKQFSGSSLESRVSSLEGRSEAREERVSFAGQMIPVNKEFYENVVKAQPSDAEAISVLAKRLLEKGHIHKETPFLFPERILEFMAKEGAFVFVYKREGQCLGYVAGLLRKDVNNAVIGHVAVDESLERQGLGTVLLVYMCKVFEDAKAKVIEMTVREEDLKPLVKRIGFKVQPDPISFSTDYYKIELASARSETREESTVPRDSFLGTGIENESLGTSDESRAEGRSEARAASNYESPKEGEPRPFPKGRVNLESEKIHTAQRTEDLRELLERIFIKVDGGADFLNIRETMAQEIMARAKRLGVPDLDGDNAPGTWKALGEKVSAAWAESLAKEIIFHAGYARAQAFADQLGLVIRENPPDWRDRVEKIFDSLGLSWLNYVRTFLDREKRPPVYFNDLVKALRIVEQNAATIEDSLSILRFMNFIGAYLFFDNAGYVIHVGSGRNLLNRERYISVPIDRDLAEADLARLDPVMREIVGQTVLKANEILFPSGRGRSEARSSQPVPATEASKAPLYGPEFRAVLDAASAYERQNTFERARAFESPKTIGPLQSLIDAINIYFKDTPLHDIFQTRVIAEKEYSKGRITERQLKSVTRAVTQMLGQLERDKVFAYDLLEDWDAVRAGRMIRTVLTMRERHLAAADVFIKKITKTVPGARMLIDNACYFRSRVEQFFTELKQRAESAGISRPGPPLLQKSERKPDAGSNQRNEGRIRPDLNNDQAETRSKKTEAVIPPNGGMTVSRGSRVRAEARVAVSLSSTSDSVPSLSRAETRVAVDTAEGVFRHASVLAMGREKFLSLLSQLMPKVYASQTTVYGPRSTVRVEKLLTSTFKAHAETGAENISIVLKNVQAKGDEVIDFVTQILARSRFLSVQLVVLGISRAELRELQTSMTREVLKHRKAQGITGRGVNLTVTGNTADIPGFIGRNQERSLVYDARSEARVALESLVPMVAKAGRSDRTLLVFGGAELRKRVYELLAAVERLFDPLKLPQGPQSAVSLLAENLQILAAVEEQVNQAA